MGIPIWDYINDIDIMVNNLVLTDSLKKKLPTHRTIWIDSGGYQILVKGLKIDVEDILKRYRSIPADFYMSLDIPCSDPSTFNEKLLYINLRNYVYLSKNLRDKKIIPIVHLYPIKYMIEAVDFYVSHGADIIAYGGIVPPMIRKTRLRLKSILGFLILKKLYPNIKFHVLGIGSYIMIRIFKKLGAFSIDTSTWRVKAAYGHVIIPGLGERYVGTKKLRFGTPYAKEEELELLYRKLKESKFPFIERFYDLIRTFKGRAIINAWVITKVNGSISPKSSFYKLYLKLQSYSKLPIEELVDLYNQLGV